MGAWTFGVVLAALLLPLAASVGPVDCGRVPPDFWCKSVELAKQCDVAGACENFLKNSENKRVQLTLLYESLCPDCQDFITKTLYRDVYLKFGAYVDIELVPFGNAKVQPDGTVKCQHGEDECRINKFEACAINYLKEPLPFIYCLELQLADSVPIQKAARKCYSTFHIGPHVVDQITHCSQSASGDKLIAAAAKRTASVYPDQHQFVPWVVFNNVSLAESQFWLRNIPIALCDWYVAKDKKPEICTGLGYRSNNQPCFRKHN